MWWLIGGVISFILLLFIFGIFVNHQLYMNRSLVRVALGSDSIFDQGPRGVLSVGLVKKQGQEHSYRGLFIEMVCGNSYQTDNFTLKISRDHIELFLSELAWPTAKPIRISRSYTFRIRPDDVLVVSRRYLGIIPSLPIKFPLSRVQRELLEKAFKQLMVSDFSVDVEA